MREPSAETYESHLTLLQRVVDSRESKGKKPPPGICAECAFYLHRLGRSSEAATFIAKEKEHYPESTPIVSALDRVISGKRALEGSEDTNNESEEES